MYYILNDSIALCSYKNIPYAFYKKYNPLLNIIDKDCYEILKKCDGLHSLNTSDPIIMQLENDKIIKRCSYKEKQLEDWQLVEADNKYLHEMEIAITYKCNMDCLHCFATSTLNHLTPELSLEQIDKLLDDAVKCGVHGIMLTGGEPMLHPDFKKIIKMIYSKGLYLFEIATNSTLLTEDLLTWMELLPNSNDIQFDISFDMLGYHDWLRNREGAEEKVIESIKLCRKHNYPVMANCNLNKVSEDALYKTVEFLESIDVNIIRLITTRRTPKWIKLADGKEYDWDEWYSLAVEFGKWFTKDNHKARVDFWGTFTFEPTEHKVITNSIRSCGYDYNGESPLCGLIARRIAVCPDGEVNICHQMTGPLKFDGRSLGNFLDSSLIDVLKDSEYQQIVESTVEDRKALNEECQKCEYWEYCQGGCPCMGHEYHKNVKGLKSPFPYYYDYSKCVFFKGDYYHKLANVLPMNWVLY